MNKEIQNIGKLVSSVNELVRMGLMQPFTSEPIIYVVKQSLQLKEKKYMTNWCRNILTVWKLSNAEKVLDMEREGKNIELIIFDKNSGELICRYHHGGIVYS